MSGRAKFSAVVAIASAAALPFSTGAALAGSTGTLQAPAVRPAAGKPCVKVGATAKLAGGAVLRCATGKAKGRPIWAVAKLAAVKAPAKTPVAKTPTQPAPAPTSGGTAAAPGDPALVARGKGLFLNGAGSQGVSCARCHGQNAMGDVGPKIVGKDAAQIRNAIMSVAQMGPFFGDLPSDQIDAIAAYLESLAR